MHLDIFRRNRGPLQRGGPDPHRRGEAPSLPQRGFLRTHTSTLTYSHPPPPLFAPWPLPLRPPPTPHPPQVNCTRFTVGDTLASCYDLILGVGLSILYVYLVFLVFPHHWLTVGVAVPVFSLCIVLSNLTPVAVKLGTVCAHVRGACCLLPVACCVSRTACCAFLACASAYLCALRV
jgi:hypothetical protein